MAFKHLKTSVLIVGGGVTGTGLARDLALRGVGCILVEKTDINAGASGGNHGLLHSGARYVASDPSSAEECRIENQVLRHIAPHAIEYTKGIFAAFEGDDEKYAADFPSMCEKCGIRAEPLDLKQVLEMEPRLSNKLIAAYLVNDGSIDPFMLSLDNMAHARSLGAVVMTNARATKFSMRKGKIRTVVCENAETGEKTNIEADIVVNAGGAWAAKIAALAGMRIGMLYSKGSLIVTQSRLAERVINRLRHPTDADILVPGGSVSILGTTSIKIEDPDKYWPEIDEVEGIIEEGSVMMPVLAETRYIRAYSGVRPLVGSDGGAGGRSVSRGFALIDHADRGVENFISITGGKLTTYRLMAERTADLVCEKLGIDKPCLTATQPLPATVDAKWTEPGLSAKTWAKKHDQEDFLLCECEMVSKTVVDSIAESMEGQGGKPSLWGIGQRSRVGKGPCQGTFCSLRIATHLYDSNKIDGDRGLGQIRKFLDRRWRGQRPLLDNSHLTRHELLEAIHCGIAGLELETKR